MWETLCRPASLHPHLNGAEKEWAVPSENINLAPGEVQAWVAALDQPPACVQALERFLSPAEQERRARFRFQHLSDAFTVGRGLLRVLLGQYLEQSPARVQIGYQPDGKPEVPGVELNFNLAHSGGLVVYAFYLGGSIGIDLELVRPLADLEAISKRFFSVSEVQALFDQSEETRRSAFYTCWTRKEAYIKGIGKGLVQPLDRFAVTLHPGDPPRLDWVDGDPQASERWTLVDLPLGPHYRGALIAEGKGWELSCWRW